MSVVASLEGGGLIIGLTDKNIAELKKDRPWKRNLKEFGGPDLEVFIIWGAKGEDIVKKLAPATTDRTTLQVDKGASLDD